MKSTKTSIEVLDFKIREVVIPIVGISPLIVHKFSEKAQRMIQEMSATDVEQVRKNTVLELKRIQQKLSVYTEFEKVVRHLDNAIDGLDSELS